MLSLSKSYDKNFFIVGNTIYDNSSTGVYYKIDNNGKISWEKGLGGSSSIRFTTITNLPDNSLLIAGTNIDENSIILLKISYHGNQYNKIEFVPEGINYSSIAPKIIRDTGDGKILIGGYIMQSGQSDAFAALWSENEGLIWFKLFGKFTSNENFISLYNNDGKYIFIGNITDYNGGKSEIWELTLDEIGNINEKRIIVTDFKMTSSVRINKKIILSAINQKNNNETLLAINLKGEILWRKELNDIYGLKIITCLRLN